MVWLYLILLIAQKKIISAITLFCHQLPWKAYENNQALMDFVMDFLVSVPENQFREISQKIV